MFHDSVASSANLLLHAGVRPVTSGGGTGVCDDDGVIEKDAVQVKGSDGK